MVSPCLIVFWFSKDNYTGHSKWKKEEEVDRRRGKKTISKSRQGCILSTQLGQLKTGQDGKRVVARSFVVPQRPYEILG